MALALPSAAKTSNWSWAVIIAVGLPLTTWIQGKAPNQVLAVTQTPIVLFMTMVLIGVLFSYIRQDWPAVALGSYMVFHSLSTASPEAFEDASLLIGGILLMLWIREAPKRARNWIRWLLVAAGGFQAIYATGQSLGYDPIWTGWAPLQGVPWIHGTLGNPNYLGAYLAMTAPLAPVWLLPLWALGLLASKSVLAAAAAASSLFLMYRQHWKILLPLLALTAGGLLWYRTGNFLSWVERIEVWGAGLKVLLGHWKSALFGFGPGSWYVLSPAVTRKFLDVRAELFVQMHNEYIQLFFEGGLIALFFLAAWCKRHWRAVFTRPFGPALVAVAIESFGFFPFHLATTAALACIVVGLATQETL